MKPLWWPQIPFRPATRKDWPKYFQSSGLPAIWLHCRWFCNIYFFTWKPLSNQFGGRNLLCNLFSFSPPPFFLSFCSFRLLAPLFRQNTFWIRMLVWFKYEVNIGSVYPKVGLWVCNVGSHHPPPRRMKYLEEYWKKAVYYISQREQWINMFF